MGYWLLTPMGWVWVLPTRLVSTDGTDTLTEAQEQDFAQWEDELGWA